MLSYWKEGVPSSEPIWHSFTAPASLTVLPPTGALVTSLRGAEGEKAVEA